MGSNERIRSLLFVPARDKHLTKIGSLGADAYIIDLEDSILPSEKDDALNRTVTFLKTQDLPSKRILVRINMDRQDEEVHALARFPVGFVLPKIQSENDYAGVASCFADRFTVALMESPKAIVDANAIAAIEWVDALAFGAEDFTASANMSDYYTNLLVPKSLLSLAAKANNKAVFDTPCFYLNDSSVLDHELEQAINLGFDGKLAIHPDQVERINAAFGCRDITQLRRIVRIYEESGKAVCVIDGRAYEKLHIDRIKRLIAKAEQS